MASEHLHAEEFLKADFPRMQDTGELMREIRKHARSKPVGEMHAEMLWRLRRREEVTIDRLAKIWPIFQRGLLVQYAHQLQDWGFIRFDGSRLELEEREP